MCGGQLKNKEASPYYFYFLRELLDYTFYDIINTSQRQIQITNKGFYADAKYEIFNGYVQDFKFFYCSKKIKDNPV